MTEKQQQLTFDKGITNVPSDALCSDNALAESVGMVYDDGEHRVIQKPAEFMTGASKNILYIHRVFDEDRYIYYEGGSIKYYTKENGVAVSNTFNGSTMGTPKHITSIGKTLIVTDSYNGIHYFLWKPRTLNDGYSYKNIGSKIPEPQFECRLQVPTRTSTHVSADYVYVYSVGSFEGIFRTNGTGAPEFNKKNQKAYNDLVIGLYSKNKKSIAHKKYFCNPFLLRYAIELYDGSYTYISNPILLMPSVSENSAAFLEDGYGFRLETYMFQLMIQQKQDFSDWSDIVKGVTLFVSDEIDIYDTSDDITIYNALGSYYVDRIVYCRALPSAPQKNQYNKVDQEYSTSFNPFKSQRKSESEIEKAIENVSVFYKLCEIGRDPINTMTSASDYIELGTLDTITSREQLPYDDYFSRCPMSAEQIYAYNNRLNLANIRRGFFDGFGFFTPYDEADSYTTTYYVAIKTNEGDKVVSFTTESTQNHPGYYFYYPDSRAYQVTIVRNNVTRYYKLKEHSGLNGAYFLAPLADMKAGTNPNDSGSAITSGSSTSERLPNTIISSEVNNPWVFTASGYNNIGSGEIIALSTITQALSEGQYGQFPLLVFCTDGIWSMSLDNTGLFTSIHPMSREVSNDPACIIQTDGAVFFTSKKGLMVVVGNQVKCVSEQMSGKTNVFRDGSNLSLVTDLGDFCEYLKNAFIAYDYRDSLLWIFNQSYTTCYVYSIKSGTFGKFTPTAKITNVVNNYPDYLLQDSTKVYSLTERADINKDGTTVSNVFTPNKYAASLLTRPMKLENALALKSIMQVKHIHSIPNLNVSGVNNPTLAFRIFASNNLMDWVELSSLRGMPWKYYRFRYYFDKLVATDRFAGTMLITQERRTNKLR